MRINIKSIPILLLIYFSLSISAKDKKNIKIIATGETHAMLNACDCEREPTGGFAKIASVIKKLKKENELLVLDAGGFFSGGIYDYYTEGRAKDSTRTISTIKVMAKIGVDAVAIGDEELQFGAKWLIKQSRESNLPLI